MEGEHTFIYGAVDNIGNNGTTMEYTVLINESLPLPPILRPATNRTRYENLLMVGWVPQDSTAWIMVNHNRTYNVTPDPEDGGNFSLYVIVDPGENIITGYTVDYFGRHSLSTNPFTVLLDREPPSTTGMNPERNSTNVPVISNIAIYFNEPLSELVIVLKYYNESNETWEIWNGEYDYVPWSLRATYIPGKPLYYETRYRISIEMLDVARNFAAHDFYSRSDHDSYSFITGDTEHVYQEFNCVIKSQKIDITYNKLGERLLRQNIWKPLAFEPLPPPKDHISLGIYFNITFDSSVTWFSLTLWDYTVSVLQDAALRNPERWDFDNLSFYRLSTDWEKLNTITVSGTEIRYFMADPGSDIITMGVFAPDLDWDGDGYLNGIDEFPRDQEEHADSDGDGIGDRSDPYPYDPHDQSLEYDTMIGPVRNANGDPIEGANVTFDHEGVQYFSITDSRGFATIRGFPLPQIPRGTIITVTHDGETVEGQYGEPLVFDTAEEEKSSGSRNIILLIVGIIVIVSILMIYIFFAVREDEEYSEDIEADYTNENRVGQYLEPER